MKKAKDLVDDERYLVAERVVVVVGVGVGVDV
jgi:hypothetical protein